MKTIRIFAAFAALLAFAPLQVHANDAYPVETVRRALANTGFSDSFSEKQVQRLGDSASIALLKLYGPEEVTNSATAESFLALIQSAFAYPELIAEPADRKPDVTLFLLKCLSEKTRDPDFRKRVEEVARAVREQTGQSR